MSTAGELFDDFGEALLEAEAGATADWERAFVAGLRARYEREGESMPLSRAQAESVRQIAA